MKKRRYKSKYSIILKDDNIHSIEHVIQTLREICGHNYFQATQCAYLVHNNGKCMIFEDRKDITTQIYNELNDIGLTVELIK